MLTKSEIPFGIDLGTTNSCGAVWWKEQTEVVRNDLGTRTTPSYYYFDGVESFVGKTAKDKRGTNPKNVYYDPMATAIYYMLECCPRLTPYVNLFILDLGGGGYSVAIIKTDRKNFETLAVGGNAKVGARDFDFLIYEWMKQKLLEEGFDVENLNQKKRFQILVQAQAVKEALRTSRETP
uniref:Heat shock protein 70 n=1 Tax=Panagrolaimus davidi TaxID=227884 RepID=A0A914QPZ6_9BILA